MLASISATNLNATRLGNTQWIIFSGEWLLVDSATQLLPDASVLKHQALSAYHNDALQLCDVHGKKQPVFVIDLGAEQPHLPDYEFDSLRNVMMHAQAGAFDIIGRAWQLVHFYRTHRFCGRCGASMAKIHWEAAMHCHTCQHRCYPRVSPCIIVAVYRDNEILLALNQRHVKTAMYSVLAGFVESGESLEHAVAREVREEVGVEIDQVEYVGSQPWPFPHALMMGYIAKWQSGTLRPDTKEIVDAKWFPLSDLPLTPPNFSIAGQLIEKVVSQQQ